MWPHFAASNFCFGIQWEVKFVFSLYVYTQNAQNFMGNSNMKQEQKVFDL